MRNFILFCAAFSLFNFVSIESADWGYPNLEKNEEFSHWGGLCDNGARQSPIDLDLHKSFKSDFQQLKFKNYEQTQKNVSLVNNGHSIQIEEFSRPMKISGGPLTDDFDVVQFHFHWYSEHTINSLRYNLECHIVHRNVKYENTTIAAKHKDGIVVVAVLYHISNRKNDAIEKVLNYVDKVKSYESVNKPIRMNEIVVMELLPIVDGYFSYAGSLTTPACAESVTWIVLHKTFPITSEQVDRFKQIEHAKGELLVNNYRQIQESHNRAVVAVTYDLNKDNSAPGLHVSIGFLTLLVFASLIQ